MSVISSFLWLLTPIYYHLWLCILNYSFGVRIQSAKVLAQDIDAWPMGLESLETGPGNLLFFHMLPYSGQSHCLKGALPQLQSRSSQALM